MSDLIAVVVIVGAVVAWFTHVFVCLSTAAWGFLIAGALFFPVGIIHGIGLWLGVF